MFNLFLRSACVRSSHCFVWFELSSQAGLAVPEPQKNVRGELVVLQNSSHLHRLVQKKYSWWPGKSWDGFRRKRRKYRQHCPTSQVHPWQDLLWNRLQIMISSFKSEHVVQIAIILINSQACWDNRVCCNQYDHQLKCSERKIYQSHQYQQNPQEHGQQTISCSVESSLPGWTTLSRLFPTKLMRAGLWFQRKTWDEYRKYTTILFDCVLGTPFGSWARFLRWRTSSGPWKMKGGRNWWEKTKKNVIIVIIIIINWIQVMEIMDEFCDTVLPVVNQLEQVWMSSLRSEILRDC